MSSEVRVPARGTSANRKRRTKRRDGDPVRVYADGRLAYWSGGRPGCGERLWERHGSIEVANTRAAFLRVELGRTCGYGPHLSRTMAELMQDMLTAMRADEAAPGTIGQYKSNWNRWTPEWVSVDRCSNMSLRHWTAFFDRLTTERASEGTVRAVKRTLNALVKFGVPRGYFVSPDPFGDPLTRQSVYENALRKSRVWQSEEAGKFPPSVCPTREDVEGFAEAFEAMYPGYGRRLVLLGYATGMRINELLALEAPAVRIEDGEIDVDVQLDRSKHWPATRLPKGDKTRTTIFWHCYRWVVESLVADSLARDPEDPEYGRLFPRHRSTVGWADQAKVLAKGAVDSCDWAWTFHWLRHGFASQSLAPESVGGYELDPVSVQHWLGHARLSTTQDMYLEPQCDDAATARERTAVEPPSRRPAEPRRLAS